MEQVTEQKITKDTLIGELVQKYPSLAEVLLDEGVHCVGCGAAYFETIEQGLGGHGKTPEEINLIIEKLNKAIPGESGSSDKLIITDNAAEKLKALLKEKNKEGHGLRISVTPGGCSGFQYVFELENGQKEGDYIHEISGVKFYVNAESSEKLKGAKLDYVDSLQGSGFKIHNPNAKSTCGCGQSFS